MLIYYTVLMFDEILQQYPGLCYRVVIKTTTDCNVDAPVKILPRIP